MSANASRISGQTPCEGSKSSSKWRLPAWLEAGPLEVLRNAAFRSLWLAKLLSQVGSQISRVALILSFAGHRNSVAAIGFLVCFEIVPGVVASFLAGAAADRSNKRSILIGTDLARMALAGVAMAWPGTWVIYGVVAAQSVAGAFFNPARSSAVPLLVKEGSLANANALDQAASTAVLIVGPAIAAGLYYTFGLRMTLAIDSLSYLASALLLLAVAIPVVRASGGNALWGQMREGWHYLRRHAIARQIVLLGAISMFCVGLWVPVAPLFATQFLHAPVSTVSLQLTAFGIGGLCATPLAPYLAAKLGRGPLMAVSLLAEAGMMLVYSFTHNAYVSTAVIFVWGAVVVGISVSSVSLMQETVAQSHLGRVFSILDQTENSATLGAIFGAIVLQSLLPPEKIFTVAALAYLALVAGLLVVTRDRNILSPVAAVAALLCLTGCAAVPHERSEFHLRKIVSDAQGGGDSAISPDGTRFVTSLQRSGNWDLWIYDMREKQWTQVTTDATDEFEAKWSPDARSLVFTSTRKGNKDVFLIDLATKATRQLTDDPEDDEYPVFSPDGKQVAFTGGPWKQRNFFLVDVDGKNRRAIAKEASQAGACSFHPSGESLICHNYDSGTGNVYLYPAGGGERLRITNGRFWDYKPAISPDGKWLAFSRSQEGPSGIYAMPFPVGEARPVTDSDGDDRWPTWSASGEKVLFHRLVDRGLGIEVLDRATGKVERLAGPEEQPGPASLDPTGKALVYASGQGMKERLRVKRLDSGRVATLAIPFPASFPRWSPDGKRIAFAIRDNERWDVATVAPDGGDLHIWTRSLENLRGVRSSLDWSPNSNQIVFHASEVPFEANLYLVDLRSGKLTNVTRDHWYSEAPSFSPDGRNIVFMSTRGGNWTWGFFRYELESGKFETLAGPDYVEKNYPRLNRDASLLWSEMTPLGKEFVSERPAGGKSRSRQEVNGWSRWPSYSADGSKILYTKLDHQVEYWVAENMTGEHSPLRSPKGTAGATLSSKMAAAGLPGSEGKIATAECKDNAGEPNRSAKRSSPVQMHHR